MGSQGAFVWARGRRDYHVGERLILRDAPQPARLPLAKVVLHAALATLAEQTPRFPPRAWHHGHVGEGFVCVLRAVPAGQQYAERLLREREKELLEVRPLLIG